ncbi:Ulp1 protease [Catovirus CTV1]|uniref:Ulp1 protease n=1 Tax=Catovirus CTV1 TaxID=1977631 RepID=A0A1V0SC20_9VIRU|nr:Ulp1 protease [Catovirus CTV1]
MENDIDSVRSSEIKINNEGDGKCAPSIKLTDHSCIQLNILIEMVNAYNKHNPNSPIKLYKNFESLNPSKYKKYLLAQIKNKLKSTCSSQKCWTEQDFIDSMNNNTKEELLKFTFRPEGPEGKFEWLNTINIEEVMRQYEKKHRDFVFLGAVPIDFDELPVLGIKDLNLNKLISKGKVKLGIVFNLDKHNQGGSHWVSMYADLEKGLIYFYDSYGIRPANEIRSFMRRVHKFCELSLGKKDVVCDHNKIRHQYGNSECGVYSINFILRLLDGDSFEKICNDKTSDEDINKLRNVYFY